MSGDLEDKVTEESILYELLEYFVKKQDPEIVVSLLNCTAIQYNINFILQFIKFSLSLVLYLFRNAKMME